MTNETPSGFVTPTKLTIIEALRDVFDAATDQSLKPFPRKIDLEFPENKEDWPCIVVQLQVNNIGWTGLGPDEVAQVSPTQWKKFRHGIFEGFMDLSIYALTSTEKDRMWDVLISLFLMGRRPETQGFYSRVETGEVVGLTIMEGAAEPMGDSISQGTPWDDEELTYEAGIRIGLVGEFYSDEFDRILPTLDEITDHGTLEGAEAPYPGAGGTGTWWPA